MLSMHEVLKNKISPPPNAANQQHDYKSDGYPTVTDSEYDQRSEENVTKKGKFTLFSRRNIYILFYIICLIGCIYQMIEVLILYFKYETVTTLNIEKSTKVIPPSMSLCFPYITLIKLTLLFEKYPSFLPIAYSVMNKSGEKIDFETHRMKNFKKKKGKFDWEFGEYVEKHLSIEEIISVTVTLDEMFEQCVFLSPDTYLPVEADKLEICRRLWDIDVFIKDENKCFLFAYKPIPGKQHVYNLQKLSNAYSYRNLLQQIRLNWKVGLTEDIERAYVIFHPRERFPRGRGDPILTLRYPGKDVAYTISYSKTVSELLPDPYGKGCRDYSEIGYESRADCVDKCVIERTYPTYRRVPYTLMFTKESGLKVFSLKMLTYNQTYITEFQQLDVDCRSVCKQRDCYNEYYTPQLINTEKGTNLKFIVEIPSAADTLTELSPKLTLLEYIIYNTSVFGFWFGLCVLQLADFVEYIKKKRRDARRLKRILKSKSFSKNSESKRMSQHR